MKKSSLLVWIFFLGIVTTFWGQIQKDFITHSHYYTKQELVQDLDTLVACLERYHPSLYAFQTPEEWENSQQKTREILKDSMTALDVYPIFSAFIHKIHCGHTQLYPSENLSLWYPHYFKELPIKLHLLNDTIFVYDNFQTKIPKGSVITKIGNYTTQEIISKLDSTVLNRDGNREDIFNYMFSDNMFSMFFADASNERYSIEYQNYETKSLEKDTLTLRYFFMQKKKEKVEDYFSYKLLPNNVAVLTIKTFQNDQIKQLEPLLTRYFCEGLKTRIKHAFHRAKRDNVEHLIIDIRENGGGNPYLAYQICSYVLDEQFQYFEFFKTNNNMLPKLYSKNMLLVDSMNTRCFYDKNTLYTYKKKEPNTVYQNQLYLLVDDGTYSTAVQLASLLKFHQRAIVIGQKTAGIADYCNAYQFVQYELPNTKTYCLTPIFKVPLAVKISDKEGVVPDFIVKPTIYDKIQQKDTQLDFTLKLIQQRGYQHTHQTEKP